MVRVQQLHDSKADRTHWTRWFSAQRRVLLLLQLVAIFELVAVIAFWLGRPDPIDPGILVTNPEQLEWDFPIPNQTHTMEKRAIFLLSMGTEAAASTIVERSVLSIRRIGAFWGPVVLLTDAPASRYHSLTKTDKQLVILHPPATDWRRDLLEDMPYKRFKTFVLDYLILDPRLSSVKMAYYLDIDVIVGKPLDPWFHHVESTYLLPSPHNNQTKSQIIFFKGNSKRRPLQGGQFLAQRGTSEGCLKRWRHFIDSNPEDPKDQSALTMILMEQENVTAPCHFTIMPQEPHLRFLDSQVMKELIHTKDFPTLMHIKNTEEAAWVPLAVQQDFFRHALKLSPQELGVIGKTQIHPSREHPTNN